MIEHCAMVEEERAKDRAYRLYVADTMYFINGSISNFLGGQMMRNRLGELLKPQKEETRTPEEIISHISDKLNNMAG